MGCLSFLASLLTGIVNFFEEAWELAIGALEDLAVAIWKEIGYPIVKYVFNALGYTDETIYTNAVITTKLLTSEVADTMALGTLRAVLTNVNIVDELLRTLRIGPVVTSEGYLDYAREEYTHGLPQVSYDFRKFDASVVKSIIEAEVGEEIYLNTTKLGYPSIASWCNHYLNGYLPGLADAPQYYFHYEGWTNQWAWVNAGQPTHEVDIDRTAPDPRIWEYDPITNTFRIPWSYSPSDLRWFENIPGPSDEEYYFIEYVLAADRDSLPTNQATEYSWQYERGSGMYPELDGPTGVVDYYNEVLPIVPLRRDFYGTNDPASPTYDSEEERTARILLNKLNFDYDELVQNIADNPDEDKVEDAFLMFATNIYTEDEAELDVLFNLFENFHNDTLVTKTEYLTDTTKVTTNVIRIREQFFNAVISYNYIESYLEAASDPLDTITSEVFVIPNGGEDDPEVLSYFTLGKQISATERKVLLVHGPVIYHNIKTTAGVFKVSTIQLSNDQQEMDNFSIPLTLDSLDGLDYHDKEKVLYKALSLVIYAADEQWVVWYETERFTKAFIAVLQIVSIYLTIVSFGGSNSITAAVVQLARQLLINYAVTMLIYEILKEFGVEGAIALIVIAAAKFFGGDDNWADALMDLVLFTIDMSISLTNLAMLELDKEAADFLKTQEEKEEELQEAWDMLNGDGGIDLFDLQMILNTHPEESPGDFYERTIHTGNPGVAILDQVPDYADSMLQLPEFKQDLGGSSFTNI